MNGLTDEFADLPTDDLTPITADDAARYAGASGRAKPPDPLPRFRPLSAIVDGLVGTQWLVKPILEADALAGWFGDSGSFKSFVALDVGLCLAYGIPWHDMPTHQGAVFYVCGEGQAGIARRVEAWRIHHQVKRSDAPFFVSELPAQFIEKASAEGVANAVELLAKEKGCEPKLIIVDTLSTNFGAGDESSNPDMATLMENLNVNVRHRFKCAVVIVHHTGHGNKDRARGASAFRSNLDSSIRIARQPESMTTALFCDKQKDAPDFEPIAFKAAVIHIPDLYDSEGEPQTSLALDVTEYHEPADKADLKGNMAEALCLLRELHEEHASNQAGRDGAVPRVTSTDWHKRCKEHDFYKGTGAFSKAKRSLCEKGLVRIDGLFVAPVDAEC